MSESAVTTFVIHTGHLSVQNGAIAPVSMYFDMAKLFEVPANTGINYGDDRLEIPAEHASMAEELLQSHNMLYQVEGQHTQWQNVRNESVLHRLGYA